MRSAESGGQSEERLLQEGTKEAVLKVSAEVLVLSVLEAPLTDDPINTTDIRLRSHSLYL